MLDARTAPNQYVTHQRGRKQPVFNHPRGRIEAIRKLLGIVDGAGVVSDDVSVGTPIDATALGATKTTKSRCNSKRKDLERDGGLETIDTFVCRRDHNESVGGRRHDLLPRMRCAAPLHEPTTRSDLIGTVNRDMQAIQAVEPFYAKPESSSSVGRLNGGCNADQVEFAARKRRQEVANCRSRPETDTHTALDQPGRRLGRQPLFFIVGSVVRQLDPNRDQPLDVSAN
jgi:hypothetical protein